MVLWVGVFIVCVLMGEVCVCMCGKNCFFLLLLF